jgi:hypothetical protein
MKIPEVNEPEASETADERLTPFTRHQLESIGRFMQRQLFRASAVAKSAKSLAEYDAPARLRDGLREAIAATLDMIEEGNFVEEAAPV